MSEQHLKRPPKLAKILCDADSFFIDLRVCFLFNVTISYTVAKRTNTGIQWYFAFFNRMLNDQDMVRGRDHRAEKIQFYTENWTKLQSKLGL